MRKASGYFLKNINERRVKNILYLFVAFFSLLFSSYVAADNTAKNITGIRANIETNIAGKEIPVFEYGPYPVGTSNVRIAQAFSKLSGEEMDRYLIGEHTKDRWHFIDEILSEKDSSLLFDVLIPDELSLYGPAAGESISVFIHITYPTSSDNSREYYDFPYARTQDTRFEHMQGEGEKPIFADEKTQYPLVFDSHGLNAHGFWSASSPTKLSSHGYVVATIHYGDARFKKEGEIYFQENLRPFVANRALSYLLDHPDYKDHIDRNRIAASGHSLGGYTSLALGGGRYGEIKAETKGQTKDESDDVRINAVVASAPWIGANLNDEDHYPFGDQNSGLSTVGVPVLGLYGTNDESVPSSFVLSAFGQLSGPRYVIELVDQPHVYEPGSWQDQSNWVLLFLAAYLKHDKAAREELALATSMQDGGVDRQRFELQHLGAKNN